MKKYWLFFFCNLIFLPNLLTQTFTSFIKASEEAIENKDYYRALQYYTTLEEFGPSYANSINRKLIEVVNRLEADKASKNGVLQNKVNPKEELDPKEYKSFLDEAEQAYLNQKYIQAILLYLELETRVPQNSEEFWTKIRLAKKELENRFVDPRDGEIYRIFTLNKELGLGVKVTQTWMAENLNYEAKNSYCYENKKENCDQYGRLYNWDAARFACPKGWHLPSDMECQMLKHLLAKENENKFDIKFGGNRGDNGKFYWLGENAYFWSATTLSSRNAWYYSLVRGNKIFKRDSGYHKGDALSCRCIKD